MHKIHFSYLILFTILTTNCKTKQTYTLHGVIGKGMESILTIEIKGDKVVGKFYYPQDKKSINVSGELKNNTLMLNEYDDNNQIGGYFVGAFNQSKYEGRWTDPKGRLSAKFKYTILNLTADSEDETKTKNSSNDKIYTAYQNWVFQMVKSGDYCYEKQWVENRKRHEKNGNHYFGGDGQDALPDDLGKVKYGYINSDKIIDAWAYVVPLYDIEGSYINGMRHLPLFFLSKPDGSYSVINEPETINSGTFGGVDTILPNGTIIYESREYQDDDARCCPSKSWKTRYKFQNNQFVRIK